MGTRFKKLVLSNEFLGASGYSFRFMDGSKTSAPRTAEPQLRGLGGEGPVFFKIWYDHFGTTFILASLSGIYF